MNGARTELGRIQSIKIGHGGYQGAMFGVSFTLGGKGWGVGDFWGAWSPALMERSERCQWTEADRLGQLADMCAKVAALLKEAGVNEVSELAGKPVEITFKDSNLLDSWRLLTEVLP